MDTEIAEFLQSMMRLREDAERVITALEGPAKHLITVFLPPDIRETHVRQMDIAANMMRIQLQIIAHLSETALELADAVEQLQVQLADDSQ